MEPELFETIKLHTISALVSDEVLMGLLVLKGGNALNLVYDLSSRGSIDLDFSIENDFSPKDKYFIKTELEVLLNKEFVRLNLVAFDVKFLEKPKNILDEVKDFWGGYKIEFKLISAEDYEKYKGGFNLGKRALPIGKNNSTKFLIDISKYEYVNDRKKKDLDGTVVYVYTPEMLVIEKLRALCQQVEAYRKVIIRMTSKSRARDFYDIYNLIESFRVDLGTEQNKTLASHIFGAKKVPLEFLNELNSYREFHRESWSSVKSTVNPSEVLESFDFYFDYVVAKSAPILS